VAPQRTLALLPASDGLIGLPASLMDEWSSRNFIAAYAKESSELAESS
jgi:hypothetical protein